MAKKILIVDDEPDLIKVTTFRLRKMGYDVIAGTDGEQALSLIESERPDLVLLDLRLPIRASRNGYYRLLSGKKKKPHPIKNLLEIRLSLRSDYNTAGAHRQ